jgi:hypothetical protein
MSDKYKKPVPVPTQYSKRYWEGCKNKELYFQKCSRCFKVQFYPRTICSNCWSNDLEWIRSDGVGEIRSYTIVHRAPVPEFKDDVPYVVVLVKLNEGVNLIAFLKDFGEFSEVEIGRKVKVDFEEVNQDLSIPVFKII